jgi:hypothetical protein
MAKQIDELLEVLEKKATEVTLPNTVNDLTKEVLRLRKQLETYGIEEEMHITNVEYICQKGLDDLKLLAMQGGLDSDATKTLDLLHKNLRMARGNLAKKETPGKTVSEAELLKLVNGKDKK